MRGTVAYKMTGSGNDFVMLDGRHTTAERWPATRVTAICDRRNGIGADGLVILTPDVPGRVRMAFWNSDGSRAAMCGNAALCSARLAVYLEMTGAGDLCLLTDAGVPHEAHRAIGERADEICRAARRLGVDRIVMGTARKNSITRMLEDSVTHRVLETTPVPVEVIAGDAVSKWERWGLPAGVVGLGGLLVRAAD